MILWTAELCIKKPEDHKVPNCSNNLCNNRDAQEHKHMNSNMREIERQKKKKKKKFGPPFPKSPLEIDLLLEIPLKTCARFVLVLAY